MSYKNKYIFHCKEERHLKQSKEKAVFSSGDQMNELPE